eukprot:CAMPEP_0201489672 /NCGR_PEP_ID=MMETSP0151_2-20130828/23274_1 /ASSEMBLY_ACC=CAM_ASM_000257 /TAXON_ID=200890 /ORGANISM="Paramoeba atlantica, Strain 621/1 / CCAP 1560/9" /LENGTH=72 /DNA_ID=CAMNT_0047875347 /DNA_START=181 /DNA_END=399 /DNA_ORIENTATION=-
MWDTAAMDKLVAEVPKWKVITVSVISDRLKVAGSLAREALRYLEAQGLIRAVNAGKSCKIYTRLVRKSVQEE